MPSNRTTGAIALLCMRVMARVLWTTGLATDVPDHSTKAVKIDPVPEVIVHDNATDPNIEAISQHQQDSLQYLHDDPLHFLNHEVTKNWVQDGGEVSYTGIIYSLSYSWSCSIELAVESSYRSTFLM